jgi:tyrosine-specific transport protein
MRIFHSLGHVIGGSLLVAGTTIGVGMLALPVATGEAGFIPSFFIYLLCWIFMLSTGLLLVEVNLSLPKATGFISMAEKILGPIGKQIFWAMYLFLFLTVMIAHVAGGGEIIAQIPNWPFPYWSSAFIYTLFFAPIVYMGAKSVDRLNLFLISGVVLFYLGFVFVSMSSVKFELLKHANWTKSWLSIPVLFTAFTYQVIIPTLMTYLERDVKKIRKSIIYGSSIPLVIYLIWEFVILGIVPVNGPSGLIESVQMGHNAVTPLQNFVQSDWINIFSGFFAFFALTTSFVPLALSFYDFLADGLKWKKKGSKRLILCGISFGIPLVIAVIYPGLFLKALGYAGGISCAFLFGLMPPLMAWLSRYHRNDPILNRQLGGGKPILIILMLVSCLILIGQIIQQIA